jgi:hypothetical protein
MIIKAATEWLYVSHITTLLTAFCCNAATLRPWRPRGIILLSPISDATTTGHERRNEDYIGVHHIGFRL